MPRAKAKANKVTLLICERDEGAVDWTFPPTIVASRGAGIGRLYIQAHDGQRISQVSQGPKFYGIAGNRSKNWFLDLIDRSLQFSLGRIVGYVARAFVVLKLDLFGDFIPTSQGFKRSTTK
ncbi:hypothetical protein BPOR_0079g00130 [Botrytis porri]|uniref:Uncharacterized protein n=1 Tax=Botrytis porri TaxID=87229 RepID=A0A4Z1L071_9HELO|nr:hypothetical protein BPOR_0079g00130 [Botrytis porri]